MGGGLVIKYNANLSYCTDSVSAGVFRKICGRAVLRVLIRQSLLPVLTS